MKKRWICSILAVSLALSGCMYAGGSIDSLLRPPRLTDEQNDIWLALKEDMQGDSIKLVYPQKGENRSAIMLTNLDNEPTEEAVVFFQPVATATAIVPIRMKILDKVDGAWQSMYDLVMDGTQVEDVSVINVGAETPFLAVGLNFVGEGNRLLKVLQFDGKTLNTIFSQNYQTKGFYDFTGDGKEDILLVETRESEMKTSAKLFCYENYRFTVAGSTLMNPEVSRYTAMIHGRLESGEQAVYLDGYKGSDLMTTEILLYEKGTKKLVNLTYDGKSSEKYPINRVPIASCYDLSNDGVIEVPGVRPLPGYEENSTSPLYLTDWYHFTDDGFQRVESTYVNASLGYMLTFPEKWIGKVSAQKTTQENEIMFFEYRMDENPSENALLYLQAVSRSEWMEKKASSEYELIDTRGQIVYLAKIPQTKSRFQITLAQVKEYFSRFI